MSLKYLALDIFSVKTQWNSQRWFFSCSFFPHHMGWSDQCGYLLLNSFILFLISALCLSLFLLWDSVGLHAVSALLSGANELMKTVFGLISMTIVYRSPSKAPRCQINYHLGFPATVLFFSANFYGAQTTSWVHSHDPAGSLFSLTWKDVPFLSLSVCGGQTWLATLKDP